MAVGTNIYGNEIEFTGCHGQGYECHKELNNFNRLLHKTRGFECCLSFSSPSQVNGRLL